MTLLEDIQSAAVDADSDLGTLLRKCKLLAARLGSKSLEEWLIWESNGYPAKVKVPDYRTWPLEVKGHFAGPFGSGLRNASIPFALLPAEVRDNYYHYECRQSVASIEAILAKAEGGNVQVSTGDLALALGTKVYENQNCLAAWAEFGSGHLVELLNSVRNRIMDFALAVWKEHPTAGESESNSSDTIKASRITQIFNTSVYGGSANLVGSASDSIVTFNIATGDISSLEHVLRENGVAEDDLKELKASLEAEKVPASKKGFGPKVSSWIAGMMKKAADGTWAVGVSAAGTLLAEAIAKYYGL